MNRHMYPNFDLLALILYLDWGRVLCDPLNRILSVTPRDFVVSEIGNAKAERNVSRTSAKASGSSTKVEEDTIQNI